MAEGDTGRVENQPDKVVVDAPKPNPPRWTKGRANTKRALPGSTMEALGKPSPLGFRSADRLDEPVPAGSTLGDQPVGGERFDLNAQMVEGTGGSAAEKVTWPMLAAARMRPDGADPLPEVPAASGLDAVFSVVVLPRQPGPRPPIVEGDDAAAAVGRVPEPLEVEGALSALSAGQRKLKLRETGNVLEYRLDCRHQRFVSVRLVRSRYDFPDEPRRPAVLAEHPADLLPRSCLDAGGLAQLVLSRFGDHASLRSLSDLFAELGRSVSVERLGDWLARLARLLRPVALELRRQVVADKGALVDPNGAPVMWEDPRLTGTIRAVRGAPGVALAWIPRGGEDPFASVRAGEVELAQNLALDAEGASPGGRAAACRHRFFLAARVAPSEARKGRRLLEDLQLAEAASADAGADAAADTAWSAYRSWLDAEAKRIDRPHDAYEGAVCVADQFGDAIRAAAPRAAGVSPRVRPWMLYRFDGGPEALEVHATLVLSALRVGVRPWPWLRDLFAAHAQGAVVEPSRWTPQAWQRSR